MHKTWKIVVKDLFELFQARYLLFWLLVLPILLLVLTGDIGLHDPTIRVLVIPHEKASPSSKSIVNILNEVSNIIVAEEKIPPGNLLQYMQKKHVDVAIDWHNKRWVIYSQQYPIKQLFTSLAHSFSQEIGSLSLVYLREQEQLNQLPSFFLFFAPRFGKDLSNVPIFISLVIAFYPFVLASGSYIREREGGTLDILLVAPGITWNHVYWGKIILPILITLISFFLQLIFAQSWFGFGMKSGFFGLLVQQILAMLSSAFLGLAISTFLRSHQNIYLASAIYLLCLILLTGIFFPLSQASIPVVVISKLFPLTFSAPPFASWMSTGTSVGSYPNETLFLGIQCAGYFFLSMLSFHWEKKRI